MKTKKTLKKDFNFKRKTILKFTFFMILFNVAISYSQSNQCNATLIVEKDRNVRSAPQNGTYYSMILTNNATVTNTFSLNSSIINNSCQNPDNSSSSQNVIVTSNFLDKNLNSISEITISPGQKIKFFVHITVPIGTSTSKWCCTKISATSNICPTYEVNTVLQTLVIKSTED